MRRIVPIEHRFWSKVAQAGPNDCWLWTGKLAKGYGMLGRGRKSEGLVYAHRLAWEMANGPIPANKEVCHSCDTPACVNARHLFLGDRQANVDDCVAKKRHRHGETHHNAKLTAADIIAIRASPLHRFILAKQYGVTPAHIWHIRNGRRRKAG